MLRFNRLVSSALTLRQAARAFSSGGDASAANFRKLPCQADSLLALGTRDLYDSDHDMYRESARKFFDTEVIPFHNAWEEQGHVPRELWQAAGKNGLLCVTMPEKYGGPGTDVLYSSVVWEEQGYSLCTGPGFALHSEIVAPYILNYGTEEQKHKYLPKMASGDFIGAIAMSEPGAGSDLQGVRTNAVKDGDGYILNGSKTFITNGYHSDVVIVVAKTAPEKGAHGISLFLVDAGTPGFSKGRKLKKMGLRAQDTSELFFEDVRLPASALLGQENKGFYYLMNELPQERLLIAVMGLSAAESVFEHTRKYAKERKAFGKPLEAMQTMRHKLAEIKTELAVGRSFVDQCVKLHHEKRLDSATASMCKYWITDLQTKSIDRCLQVFGGWGYMWEYPVCRAFVDARVQPIYGGTNEIMKELIARGI